MKRMVLAAILLVATTSFGQVGAPPMQFFWKLQNGTLMPAVSSWRVAGEVALGGIGYDSSGFAAVTIDSTRLIGRTGPRGFVIDSLFIVGKATANSDTAKFDISYSTNIYSAGTSIITAPDTIAGVSPNTSTGYRRGTFNNATIPANNFVFLTLKKRTGAWKQLFVILQGHVP